MGSPFRHAGHHREHRLGTVEGLHLTFLIDAEHHRFIRRVVIQADHVDDFPTNSGSLDNLKLSVRCGLSPKSRQIRPTVDLDKPDRAAIDVRDQCVALFGVCSNVAVTTAST